MKRNIVRIAVMLAVIAVAIISLGAVIKARNGKEQKVEIKTAKVERGDVTSTVSATGTLQPLTLIDLKSNVGGKVETLTVDVGSLVKKGQLIATIDPTDSQAQLDQAQANLARDRARKEQAHQNLELQKKQSESQIAQAKQALFSAQARLRSAQNQADTQPELTKASIASAQANLDGAKEALRQLKEATIPQTKTQALSNLSQAESNLKTADNNLKRQKMLMDRGFLPASAMDTAQSQYESAKSAYETAKRKADTVDQEYSSEVRSAEARVAQAQAQLVSAQRNAVQDRIRKDDLAAARASVEQAKAELELAYANKRQIAVREKDITAADAAIVSSEASVHQAEVNLTYATISAPRNAVVLQKYVEQGTIITSGKSSIAQGTNIVQLGDISRMFVLCNVDETDIGSIEMGQKVDITIDAYPSEIFEGKVTRIDPQAKLDQNVTTIPVTVEIDNPDLRLKPAMNATCEFIIAKHENVLTVPNEAVKEENGSYTVTVLQAGQQIVKPVETGIAGPDATEIREGLKEGDLVITQIIEPQKDGSSSQGGVRSPFGSPFGGGPPRRGGGGGGAGGGGGSRGGGR
jgi:HlyD family secretion protein